MTTKEAIEERKKAEKKVSKILLDLEKETGLRVSRVDFDQEAQENFGSGVIVISEIRIRLEA